MKKRKKTKWMCSALLMVCICAMVALGGCGSKDTDVASKGDLVEDEEGQENTNEQDSSKETSEKEEPEIAIGYPKMDEIDYYFYDSIRYEEPVALFGYENHSNYTIVEMTLYFEMKEGITPEQLELFAPFKERWENLTDEEILELTPEIYDHMVADPGEKVEGGLIDFLYNTEATNTAQCELIELESASIYYIAEDNMIHTVNYLSENGAHALLDYREEPCEWSESAYAQMVPKPDSKVVKVDYDKEDVFICTAYDMDFQDFEAYIEKCKEAGYTELEDGRTSYHMLNEQGYKLHMRYLDYLGCVEITLKAHEETEY